MVADGVGGRGAGEAASRRTITAVTRYVSESIGAYYTADSTDHAAFTGALHAAALRVHEDLLEAGELDPSQAGMATTLTLWIGVWPHIYLLQVGDSRHYAFRDGQLFQESRDQTIGQVLVDKGVLTDSQAHRLSVGSVLSSTLGGSESEPAVKRLDSGWGHVHMLCSDGLTKHVSDERIRERLASMTSARQGCEALLQDALDDGGSDNITIVIGRAIRKD
jgi:protein phosphatase